MAKSSMQKQKLLYLQKIMLEKTDENHALSANEIKQALGAYGIRTERKSLYDDLKILETFGLDICRTRTTTVKYYVGSRDFEMPELKLLVDAIQSSKFITHKKSLSLIKKLEGLVSENEGKQLQRQVYVSNRVKNVNEKIYYNVDTLHNAIAREKQVAFKYCKWETDFNSEKKIVKVERKNGAIYKVSPWALCWDDENYYLIAHSERHGLTHYRVDKMDTITATGTPRIQTEESRNLNLAAYAKKVFGMFGGEETNVRLRFDRSLAGVVIDRFGRDCMLIPDGAEHFTVTVTVAVSPLFLGWLAGFGQKVQILYPQSVIDAYRALLAPALALYPE